MCIQVGGMCIQVAACVVGCMCIQVAARAEGLGFNSQLVPECPLLNRRVKKKVNL